VTTGLVAVGAVAAVSAPAAGAAGANKLTVKAGEYTYKFSGSPKAGWTEIKFDNAGIESHMMGLVRLKQGVTVKQLKTALLSDDPDAGANLVVGTGDVSPQPGLLGPKQKMGILLQLPAGHYGVFCFIPAPDGAPHVAHGMVKVFDIAGGKSSLTPPKDGVIDVTLTDTAVTVPRDTLPRKGYVRVTNEGSEARTWNIAELEPGVTVEQADAYFDQFFQGTAPEGEPPAVLAGGVMGLKPNAVTYLVLDYAAGSYAYSNELSDADNDPNAVLGTFTVK
jgi:hypothetical protein